MILIPMSIPLFFVSFFFIRNEYREFFVYGERTFAILEEISTRSSTGGRKGGGGKTFFTYHLRVPSKDNVILEDGRQSYDYRKAERLKLYDLNIGDTIGIKILSKYEAKMLSHKDMKINEYNSFWNNFWIFLLITSMLFVATYPYYLIIFKPRKK